MFQILGNILHYSFYESGNYMGNTEIITSIKACYILYYNINIFNIVKINI